jgi:4-amino-4-deoxy-L-arabinose transferase-like glycosyltransferase
MDLDRLVLTKEPGGEVRAVSAVYLVVALVLLMGLVVPGLRWGVPSEERNRLTFGPDRSKWHAPALTASERESPWAAYPNNLSDGAPRTGTQPRSAFNPVRSYHPDEYVVFKSLSGMRPGEFQFFHGFFGWPALQFYVVGGALKVASWFGAVKLVPDMDFYFQNPDEMARLYVVGRVVTLLFALGTLGVVWLAGSRLFGPAGGVAACLLLAVTPLFVINAHYMTADVPMLFWISLVVLASTYILRGGNWRAYALSGVALGLAAATRYQGALAACVIVAAHLARPPMESEQGVSRRGVFWRRAKSLVTPRELWLAAAISVFVFLLVNPYIVLRFPQFAREFAGEFSGSHGTQGLFQWTVLAVMTGLGVFFFLAAAASAWLLAARPIREGMFLLFGLGVPALLLWLTHPAMVRYLMPALLLPIFLTAYAFTLFDCAARAISGHAAELAVTADTSGTAAHAKARARARWVPAILLAIVIGVTGLQAWSFAELYSTSFGDTRTRAGEWIEANVRPGATIAIVSDTDTVDPWVFETPPINAERYKLVPLRRDAADSAVSGWFWVVASDVQFPPVALRDLACPAGGTAGEDRPWYATIPNTSGWHVVAWPLGWKSILTQGPHDMRYANPDIMISYVFKGDASR